MKNWPHAPPHWLFEPGLYMVTAGTFQKQHLLRTPERLDLVMHGLFAVAAEFGWTLRAWAVMSNHYHFVASSPPEAKTLGRMLGKLHMTTARELNRQDGTPGRKVWYQFRDTHLTHQTSYLARLKYVHFNPQHHGVIADATDYRWCSAAWFYQSATPAFAKTIESFKTDTLNVDDNF